MRIKVLTISDYKRVRHVQITPAADSHLILIGGRNRQGKSTTLDALSAALGGAKAIAADPVRHGAQVATIRIELGGADGALTVERTIEPNGTTQLVVRDDDGPLRRPQEMLDRLIGARFLDPLSFIRLRAADQRAALMRVIPNATEIQQLDERRERSFRNRTDTGRDLARARGELERLPPAVPAGFDPEPAIDVAALAAEQRAFAEQQRAGEDVGHAVAQLTARRQVARDGADAAAKHVAEVESKLERARHLHDSKVAEAAAVDAELVAAQSRLDAARKAWADTTPRRHELEQDLARAGAHNRKVIEHEQATRRRAETTATVDKLAAEVDKLSTSIKACDTRKAAILAESPMPVDGIVIGDAGLLVAGDDGVAVPFAEASASQQWTVALGLAIAAAPALDDIWIKDAAVLEDEAIEAIGQLAADSGKRVWIERVGTRDPGVIVIDDGQIAGSA